MAVRAAYDPTAGEVLTAVNLEKLAGGWIGYADTATSQGPITAEADLTSLTVTVTVGTGRRIRITGYTWLSSNVADDVAAVYIKEGTTYLGRGQVTCALASAGNTATGQAVITPTAGAHTYKLACARPTGSGNVTSNASPSDLPFILVEDIGSA